jgi:Tfp pilus assembly protein PilW
MPNMASMITSTFPTKRTGAFSLVEIVVATSMSGVLMTGILSSFVLLGQTSYNAANYSIMEAESRRALETFTQEARMADRITWTDEHTVTLSVATASGSILVTYAYDAGEGTPTAGAFYRKVGAAGVAGPTRILVRNVTEFSFGRYKVINGEDFSASNDLETKQLQITLRTVRTGITTVNTTNTVLSARVVLRNKHVST